jgi:hypothetical protein
MICIRCYHRKYWESHKKEILERRQEYRHTHKEQIHERNRRRVVFKGQQVCLESCPRIGLCSTCVKKIWVDSIKRTNMHHDEYHDDAPLRDTRELSVSCHSKEHVLMRNGGYNRRCSICHADNTYIDSSGYEYWLFDKDVGLICRRCYNKKYRQRNKARIRERDTKYYQIHLKERRKYFRMYYRTYKKIPSKLSGIRQ